MTVQNIARSKIFRYVILLVIYFEEEKAIGIVHFNSYSL